MHPDLIKIALKAGDTLTSLYHSPFDYNLLYLIYFAKTGLKLRLIIDDIDNLGVNKETRAQAYSFAEKYYMSKTERTNLRSLTLLTPKHLLANLSYPDLKRFDIELGVETAKNNLFYFGTVEHWIRDITGRYGTFSLVGPDKAFAVSVIDDDFINAIQLAKTTLICLLKKFPARYEKSAQFVEWIFNEKRLMKGQKVSEYFCDMLLSIISRFNLSENVTVERMSDQRVQVATTRMLQMYKSRKDIQDSYHEAIKIDSKKSSDEIPFYAIDKTSGERLLPVALYEADPCKYLVAPKVLMLNNFQNLILPLHAIQSKNVIAREHMYKNNGLLCNQIFCGAEWLDYLSSFDLDVDLDSDEQEIYGERSLKLSDLPKFIIKSKESYLDESNPFDVRYRNWIIYSSLNAFQKLGYPLVFLALLQDEIFTTEAPSLYKLKS